MENKNNKYLSEEILEEDLYLFEEAFKDHTIPNGDFDLVMVIEEQIYLLDYVKEIYDKLREKYTSDQAIDLIGKVYLKALENGSLGVEYQKLLQELI